MAYEVTIEQVKGTTRINVPFDIPTTLLDAGAIELYATQLCGWKSVLKQITVIDGSPSAEDIPNPLSAIDAVASRLRNSLKDEYAQLLKQKAAQDAMVAADEQFNKLFPA